jgi:hypothetical protein
MLTHHGARDPRTGDVTRTAAHVTKVGLAPDGSGTFEADVADTQAGRDVAALTTPANPYLKGVSMAAVWKGTPRMVMAPDGSGPCETADGIGVVGIDLTHNPGVDGAEIHSAQFAEAAPAGLIYESIEENVTVEETNNVLPLPHDAMVSLATLMRDIKLTKPAARRLANHWDVDESVVFRAIGLLTEARAANALEILESDQTVAAAAVDGYATVVTSRLWAGLRKDRQQQRQQELNNQMESITASAAAKSASDWSHRELESMIEQAVYH